MFSNLSISKKLYAGFGAVLVILLVVVSVAYFTFGRLNEALLWDNHTHAVLTAASNLNTALLNMETIERGYVITGADHFLEPLNKNRQDYADAFKEVRELTADNPRQQERLKKLETQYDSWMTSVIEPVIALRRTSGAGKGAKEAADFEASGKGKSYMDAMRDTIGEIVSEERLLLKQRTEHTEELQATMMNVLTIGGLLGVIVAITLAIAISRAVVRPVTEALEASKRLAKGNTEFDLVASSQDETGQMLRALQEVVVSQREMARVAEKIAAGDLTATASPRSEQDQLGRAFASMLDKLSGVIAEVREASKRARCCGRSGFVDVAVAVAGHHRTGGVGRRDDVEPRADELLDHAERREQPAHGADGGQRCARCGRDGQRRQRHGRSDALDRRSHFDH